MAERPLFIPNDNGSNLVIERSTHLKWHSGFAVSQKQRNIESLHEAGNKLGVAPILEVSSKSLTNHGRRLSAFSLRIRSRLHGEMYLENAFQGSKIFERGGPYTDLYHSDPIDAKRDPRLKTSGNLLGFEYDGFHWPTEPTTAFYDWLYISFLYKWRDWASNLARYAAFTDIEFNPARSVNCQARSLALFVALLKRNLLDNAARSPQDFLNVLRSFDYGKKPPTQVSISLDQRGI